MRLQRVTATLAVTGLTVLGLVGCSSAPAHGVTPGPAAAASGSTSGTGGGAGSTSAAGSGATSAAGTGASAAAGSACRTGVFAAQAGLAEGAVHEYVTKPYAAGKLRAGDSSATRTAALATAYAQRHLGVAVAAVKSCPTAKALVSVTGQNVEFFGLLTSKLTTRTAPANLLRAAEPLLSDVASQAGRLKVTYKPTVPTPAQLAG